MPRVSVIMPVYNEERFLAQAIESILGQTCADFEFIIVCEYGTDSEVMGIISGYAQKDNRIIVLKNDYKLGIAASLNKGIKAAKGDYIARMDGDDIALPERLETQSGFMDANPDVAICGSRVMYVDEADNELYFNDNLADDQEQIKADFLFFCFIHHPSIIFRKTDVVAYDLYYDEGLLTAEDHELWCRASRVVRISVVPKVLLKYRWHASSTSHRTDSLAGQLRVMRSNMEALGICASDEELIYLCRNTCNENIFNYRKVEKLLNNCYNLIIEKNRLLKIYDEKCLVKTLDRRMYWRGHRLRRWAVIFIKTLAISQKKLFFLALYLELNGFEATFKRIGLSIK